MSGRPPRSQEPGWLSTAGGALLLVVAGFAVGLVVGTAFEQPDLVFDQLAGRGERIAVEEVDLTPSRSIPSVSALAAETPAADAGDDFRAARPSVDSPPPRPAAPALPGRADRFAIQVGAFDDAPAARALAARLRQEGVPGYVVEAASSPWRVRVGPYPSEAEARRVARGLASEQELPTWVIRVGGS